MRCPLILVLGGTTEARALAEALAAMPGIKARLSLAGRTADPRPQPLPVVSGGFGGAEGLARYLAAERIDVLIDATHPFAARMSENAAAAAAARGIPLIALRRPEWRAEPGDRWTHVTGMAEAVTALGAAPRRVFLAIGRQQAPAFEAAPQHHYLLRSVDPVTLEVPSIDYLLDHGPFTLDGETELLLGHRIDVIVTKNSGGTATQAKLVAARRLGLPVIMVARQAPPAGVAEVGTVEEALACLAHRLAGAEKRGV
ncbi:cobalt-precorrin-6A reductase [Ensifer soli]|uniref:cobalt-precorrin-6A reductase n=1 Tax=Ciceribacter sp. sgz301302 TaxID=3342379 RepID=UPI0035B95A07